ncbi:unnamed protein product [Caenorhabditis angaria]|uniref:FAD dependent oxidoreductase domain-containing protein n=1 Tax=Caenorhabditis angaria TaxID=860376 RepID=A0A9P1IP25_9PELO|nr:unnamed protein product [Caenorhabditis angaria]
MFLISRCFTHQLMTFSNAKMPPKIAVLGAGIIGVSSALAIQQICQKNVEVTIIAERFSPDTTSDVAAGLIEPFLAGSDVERVKEWTRLTIERIKEYMSEGNLGAEEKSGYWMQSVKEVPDWLKLMKNVKVLNESEVAAIRKRPGHNFGVFYTTWYLEPTRYIDYCTKKIMENGGKIIQRKIENIDELGNDFDVIVNCTGLGSRVLFNDETIRPCRGQIVRVSCPQVRHFFIDDDFYTLINDSCLILGGTKDLDQWELEVNSKTAQKIIEGNCQNIPSLRHAKILSHHIGLRPCRPTVRLEKEIKNNYPPIIHNYGHGGSGVTIHWGCALETAELVNKTIIERKSHL